MKYNLRGKQNNSTILIERGNLGKLGEVCLSELPERSVLSRKGPSAICIVTDSNVAELYLKAVTKELELFGVPISSHVIPAGEEYKNLDTVSKIYDTLSSKGFGRDDMIVALGGGVTGDIAGFTAATYMRGMKYLVQIPTTLLAQVDSSVGGKTGVDLPSGKNLVGAFRQPDLVLIDPEVLESLPEEIFRGGMAEVIKYGCIWDKEILDMVEMAGANGALQKEQLEALIARCVAIKIHVVEEDEREESLRRILNFGHTIGHGLEKLANFTDLSHGEAVSMGMIAALQMGESAGITKNSSFERLKTLLQGNGLPTELPYPIDEVYQVMLTDKKKEGNSIHFIFIKDFGETEVRKIPVEELRQMMKVLGD